MITAMREDVMTETRIVRGKIEDGKCEVIRLQPLLNGSGGITSSTAGLLGVSASSKENSKMHALLLTSSKDE
ncbi:hypothetical protein L1987_02181 [Smallanthus sonchifolius]|uniref:Uncharacterized protein n=1 Tax=Smallanthus sonchifolius TaxID=185202 RepID=A0ACB9K758_9ASTR|nr:hypothetical protein L1987_02181 [Smallanthus sonchifolius]